MERITIQEITKKIIDERDNNIAKAFTMQIGELLRDNGIVPIMAEYTFKNLELVIDPNEYKLINKYGVSFTELDTTKHDKKVKEDLLNTILDNFGYDMFLKYSNDDESISFTNLSLMVRNEIGRLKMVEQ